MIFLHDIYTHKNNQNKLKNVEWIENPSYPMSCLFNRLRESYNLSIISVSDEYSIKMAPSISVFFNQQIKTNYENR